MGSAKALLDEIDYIKGVAVGLLIETGYLSRCEYHETLLAEGDDGSIEDAYRLANARVSSGDIKLNQGLSRRDLTDAIKEAAESAADECYSCAKIMAE